MSTAADNAVSRPRRMGVSGGEPRSGYRDVNLTNLQSDRQQLTLRVPDDPDAYDIFETRTPGQHHTIPLIADVGTQSWDDPEPIDIDEYADILVPVLPCRHPPELDALPNRPAWLGPPHEWSQDIALRRGWLYVFLDGHLWREFQVVDEGLTLREVNLDIQAGRNARPGTVQATQHVLLPARLDGRDTDVFMAYSEVQWSWAQVEAHGGLAEDDFRREENSVAAGTPAPDAIAARATRCNLSAFIQSGRGDNITSVADARDRLPFPIEINPDLAAVWLDDPLGVADAHAAQLQEAWNALTLLIESLRTGREPGRIKTERERQANDGPAPPELTAEEQQIEAQFTIATLCYQVGFASADNQDKYGESLNRARIEALLAVEARQKLRDDIGTARGHLLDWLQSDAYQDALADYRDNTALRVLKGKIAVSLHQQRLGDLPHGHDAWLDLPENRDTTPTADAAWTYLTQTLNGDNAAGQLLAQKAALTPEILRPDPTPRPRTLGWVSLDSTVGAQAAWFLDSVVSLFAKRPQVATQFSARVTVVLNSVEHVDLPRWTITSLTLQLEMPRIPSFQGSVLVASGAGLGVYRNPNNGVVRLFPENTVRRTVRVISAEFKGKAYTLQGLATKLQSKPIFAWGLGGTILGLSTFNAALSLKKLRDEGLNPKTFASALSATLGVGSAYYGIQQMVARTVANPIKQLIDSLETRSVLLGALAAGAGAVASGIDMWTNWQEDDFDAAVGHASAAIIGVGLAFALATGAGGALIAAWTVLAIGQAIVLYFAEDDPIEVFAKNGPMARRLGPTVPQGAMPWQKAQWQAEHSVAGSSFAAWQNVVTARDHLIDLLYGFRLEAEDHVDSGSLPSVDGYNSWLGLRRYTVTVHLPYFQYDRSAFEAYFRLYPGGLGRTSTLIEATAIRANPGESGVTLIYEYDLDQAIRDLSAGPRNEIERAATVACLFYSRLTMPDGPAATSFEALPRPNDTEPCYRALRPADYRYRIPIGATVESAAAHNGTMDSRAGTLAELQQSNYWTR